VAAAAKGNTVLLVVGLGISIPLIIYGSQLILKLMDRFPVVITLGAALLGWVAGEMMIEDTWMVPMLPEGSAAIHYGVPILCAVAVVLFGRWLAARSAARHEPTGAA